MCVSHVGVAAAAGVSEEEEEVVDAAGSPHKMKNTSHIAEQEMEWSMDGTVMIGSHVDQSLSA